MERVDVSILARCRDFAIARPHTITRTKVNGGLDSETVRQVISMAVGAETLVMAVGHVAGRAIAEATRAAEGRVPKAVAKARGQRLRRRAVA